MVAPASQAPLQILLVDDDPDCRMLLRDAIAETGVPHAISEAPDGQAALDFLRGSNNPRPSLIYLDLELPRRSGLELLAELKSDPDLRRIPVVILTGVSDEPQMRAAADRGANSYTLKSPKADTFLRTVMDSVNYWLTVHQHPGRATASCR